MGRAVAPPADTSAVGAPAGATPASVDATAAPDAGASFSDVLQSEGSSTSSGAATDASPSSMTPTLMGAHKRPHGRDKDSSATDEAAPSMPPVMAAPWLMPLPAHAALPEDAPRHDPPASREDRPSADTAGLGVVARSPHDGVGDPGSAHYRVGDPGSAGVSPVLNITGATTGTDETPTLPDNVRALPTMPASVAHTSMPETAGVTGAVKSPGSAGVAPVPRAWEANAGDGRDARAPSGVPADFSPRLTDATIGGYAAVDADGAGRADAHIGPMGRTHADVEGASTASATVTISSDDIPRTAPSTPEIRGVPAPPSARTVTTPASTRPAGRATTRSTVPPLAAGRATMTPVQVEHAAMTPMQAMRDLATITPKTVALDEAREPQRVVGARALPGSPADNAPALLSKTTGSIPVGAGGMIPAPVVAAAAALLTPSTPAAAHDRAGVRASDTPRLTRIDGASDAATVSRVPGVSNAFGAASAPGAPNTSRAGAAPGVVRNQGALFDVAPPGTANVLPAHAGRQDAGGPRGYAGILPATVGRQDAGDPREYASLQRDLSEKTLGTPLSGATMVEPPHHAPSGVSTRQDGAHAPAPGGQFPLVFGLPDARGQGQQGMRQPIARGRTITDDPVGAPGARKAATTALTSAKGIGPTMTADEAGSAQPLAVAPAWHDQANASAKEPARDSAFLAPIVEGVVVRQALLRTGVGSSSFHIVLQPQALGTVTVHVEQTAQGLHVTLTPQHAETGLLLDQHTSDLVGLLGVDNTGAVSVAVVMPDGRHVSVPAPHDAPPPPASGANAAFGQGLAGGAGGQGAPTGQGGSAPWAQQARATANAPSVATVSSAGMERSPVRPYRESGAARIDVQA